MKQTMMFAAIAVATLVAYANPTQLNGRLLASKEGNSLYIFGKDAAGKSNCHSAGYNYN